MIRLHDIEMGEQGPAERTGQEGIAPMEEWVGLVVIPSKPTWIHSLRHVYSSAYKHAVIVTAGFPS